MARSFKARCYKCMLLFTWDRAYELERALCPYCKKPLRGLSLNYLSGGYSFTGFTQITLWKGSERHWLSSGEPPVITGKRTRVKELDFST